MAALELQEWGAQTQQIQSQRGDGSRSSSSASSDDESRRRGSDIPTGVSVLPLLAGASADSSAAQILYTRGPSSSSNSGGGSLQASALMRSESREEKESWRATTSPPSESNRLAQPVPADSKPIIVGKNLHKTYLLGTNE